MPAVATRRKPKVMTRKKRLTPEGRLAPHIEKFAKAVAEGVSGAESYRQHVAVSWVTSGTATTEATKLLGSPAVVLRLAELRKEAGDVLERMGFTRDTALRFLAEGVTKPVGDLDENDPHTQELVRTRVAVGKGKDAEEWEVEKIKGVNKLECIKQLSTMAGWNAAERVEVTHCTSADVNAALDKFFD